MGLPSYKAPASIAQAIDTSIAIELDSPAATPANAACSPTAPDSASGETTPLASVCSASAATNAGNPAAAMAPGQAPG